MIKQLAATALAGLLSLGFASSAFASPVEGSREAQDVLRKALNDNGVTIVVNSKRCERVPGKVSFFGLYSSYTRMINVCQRDGVVGGPEVEWTESDWDTLRHEAQHVIQDCLQGTRSDGKFRTRYRDPVRLANVILGPRAGWIVRRYQSLGADEHELKLELEAYSVAKMNVPLKQARELKRFCRPIW